VKAGFEFLRSLPPLANASLATITDASNVLTVLQNFISFEFPHSDRPVWYGALAMIAWLLLQPLLMLPPPHAGCFARARAASSRCNLTSLGAQR
jgi:hypothetical protein